MWLALTDLFKARWTEDIHAEWIRNVLKERPDLTFSQLTRTKNLMNAHVRDCLVTDYEALIPNLILPDPDDSHVLAAAIQCNADVIVTFNLKDFPAQALAPYRVKSQHPDEFILQLIELNPSEVCQAAKKHRNTLKNPPSTPDDYLERLSRLGLSQSVITLREFCHQI